MPYEIIKSWITEAGLSAYILLVNDGSHHCGYVEAPPALAGKDYDTIEDVIEVHGGVTYGGKAYFLPDADNKPWVFGYDCAHCDDRTKYWDHGTWRDVAFCEAECEELAKQLIQLNNLPAPK